MIHKQFTIDALAFGGLLKFENFCSNNNLADKRNLCPPFERDNKLTPAARHVKFGVCRLINGLKADLAAVIIRT
jgi:hypothetical protein